MSCPICFEYFSEVKVTSCCFAEICGECFEDLDGKCFFCSSCCESIIPPTLNEKEKLNINFLFPTYQLRLQDSLEKVSKIRLFAQQYYTLYRSDLVSNYLGVVKQLDLYEDALNFLKENSEASWLQWTVSPTSLEYLRLNKFVQDRLPEVPKYLYFSLDQAEVTIESFNFDLSVIYILEDQAFPQKDSRFGYHKIKDLSEDKIIATTALLEGNTSFIAVNPLTMFFETKNKILVHQWIDEGRHEFYFPFQVDAITASPFGFLSYYRGHCNGYSSDLKEQWSLKLDIPIVTDKGLLDVNISYYSRQNFYLLSSFNFEDNLTYIYLISTAGSVLEKRTLPTRGDVIPGFIVTRDGMEHVVKSWSGLEIFRIPPNGDRFRVLRWFGGTKIMIQA
jgi:hypothetical protein